ncbi:MAG: glycosyltransferase family 4 protein [Thermoleophilia bacterium]|nr:glycosyltransferase family 4 protein [Thermoleophilia bacterium]
MSRPRVLFMGRNRYTLPLPGWLAKKWDAVERQIDYRVLASAGEGTERFEDERFRLIAPLRLRALDGIAFYGRLPVRARKEIRTFRPHTIVASDPYIAAAALLARGLVGGPKPRVILEVHGDWRTFTRLYGSPARRLLNPIADLVGKVALRRSDAVRAVSPYTGGLVEGVRGIPVTAAFPTYTDLLVFSSRPPALLPEEPVACFVGMLEYYKNIDGLVAAWRKVAERIPEAKLIVVGQGARRELVEELVAELPGRVEWYEELPPEGVAEAIDRATVFLLPSRSEGLPRVLMEAFARGRGAVGGRAGGIPELIEHGRTGLLVDPEDVDGLADAIVSVLSDRELAERLGREAHALYESVHTTPAEYAARMRALVDASLRDTGAVPGERPRVLIVGRRTYAFPLQGPTADALKALRETVDYCVLGRTARDAKPVKTALGPGSFHLVRRWPGSLDTLLFHLTLPFRVARLVRRFRPGVVIAESPHLGFLVLLALAFRRRNRPSLVIETHADWRSAVRHQGSRARRLVAPLADWAARYALRRADGIRALSRFTAELAEREAGVPPLESFPAYIDLSIFTARPPAPLPATPTALFVGMLEAYKNVDGLARAWASVAAELPEARLVIVGKGALIDVVERLLDDYPGRVEYHSELPPEEVARALDESTCLVLPSRSEGLGRVLIESFARGRGVVASRVGGIPDVVRHGEEGLLVDPADTEELARALVRVLSDRELAERLGDAARRRYREWDSSPDEYAAHVRSLVDRTLAGAAR